MICWRSKWSFKLMLLNSKLFIVSGSPCIPMLGGCDPTAVLEIYIVLVVYAASQKTLFIVSGIEKKASATSLVPRTPSS